MRLGRRTRERRRGVVDEPLRGLDENLLLVRGSASYLLRGFVPLTVPCSATMVLGNFAWRRVFWV